MIPYLERRLKERSTWAAIGAAVAGAAALPAPYSWIVILLAAIGALVPTTREEGCP